MQVGWERRRAMEAETARAALRWAAASGVRTASKWEGCTSELERLAWLARNARQGNEEVISELARIASTSDESTRPAARQALAMAIDAARRRARPRFSRG